MLKPLLRIAMRLGASGVLLACFSIPTRAGYFDDVYTCKSFYYGALYGCRNSSNYPFDPTESDCKFQGWGLYSSCLFGLSLPPMEPDFCANANLAFQYCLIDFGPNSGNEDLSAMMSCRTASGIDLCQ